VTIQEFQTWTREHEHRMGWHRLSRVQLLSHLFEEVGELAQSVNRVYEYRGDTRDDHLANIKMEVVDALWFIVKIADRFGVDVEEELSAFVSRADTWTVERHGSKLNNALAELRSELGME